MLVFQGWYDNPLTGCLKHKRCLGLEVRGLRSNCQQSWFLLKACGSLLHASSSAAFLLGKFGLLWLVEDIGCLPSSLHSFSLYAHLYPNFFIIQTLVKRLGMSNGPLTVKRKKGWGLSWFLQKEDSCLARTRQSIAFLSKPVQYKLPLPHKADGSTC